MEGTLTSPSLHYTSEVLSDQLPPYNSQLYLGIFLKKADGSEGNLIGDGGVHHLGTNGEWPELSYRFRMEYWGRGYATEFIGSFMGFWWSLPREETSIQIRPGTIGLNDTPTKVVAERVYASVKLENKASQRVLQKAGFQRFEEKGQIWLTHWLQKITDSPHY
jgi:RimJ/RimL family protein N-acetyltransferase